LENEVVRGGLTVKKHGVTAHETPVFLYSLFILEINIDPTALVPATPEPLIQPKIILTNTLTCATLPRILPTVIRAKFNIRSKIGRASCRETMKRTAAALL